MYLVCSVCANVVMFFFFFSSRRRHTRSLRDWSSDVCSSDLDYPRLQRDWEVILTAQVEKWTGQIERVTPKLEIVGSGQDWFEVRYSLTTPGGEVFSNADIQRLLRSGPDATRALPHQPRPRRLCRRDRARAWLRCRRSSRSIEEVHHRPRRASGCEDETRHARRDIARVSTCRFRMAHASRGEQSRRHPGRRDGSW